jgi:Na+-transporting methylmalonyl-CoA/oxaloacetate decarboxylase gamma subunit
MNLMKLSTRSKFIVIFTVLSLLAIAFFGGGNDEGRNGVSVPKQSAAATKVDLRAANSNPDKASAQTPPQVGKTAAVTGEQSKHMAAVVQKEMPKPVEPENANSIGTAHTCTLSVVCTTILDNLDRFDANKLEVLPKDGVIFPATVVTFYQGESVFNVLQRETKKAAIHMEFTAAPVYHSNYIEGIGNIYELDCGELSGWVYKVNGFVPNYGCSRYQLQDGDIIEFVYTCNLGRDVGGNNKFNGE